VQNGHRNSAPAQSFERPSLNSGAVQRARHAGADPALARRPERYVAWAPRSNDEERVRELRRARAALYLAAGTLIAFAVASAVFLTIQSGYPLGRGEFPVSQSTPDDGAADRSGKANAVISVRPKDGSSPSPPVEQPEDSTAAATPAEIIARGWSAFGEQFNRASGNKKGDDNSKGDRLAAVIRSIIAPPKSPQSAAPAALPLPIPVPMVLPRAAMHREAKISLVNFETAPFPYNGKIPGSEKSFLNGGEPGKREHINFRGQALRESETFSDDRVLLHIPQGFDANKPGVIVVFFHGHGANLSDDVRDRQEVPAQISESGVNAVLVAPQFAVNAADSSSGKFWQPDGFKRFLDETAKQFAKLNGGDTRAARAFARMPIVIVAYSGGFGPTLSVLEHGGANSRIRGIVLLDALYSGTEKFADWISSHRTAFFVSSYTPHIRRQNNELERLLTGKSITVGSELKPNRLPGSVTFLPTGDISHRDFVNHAWAENPIKDILLRLDETGPTPAGDARSVLSVARR
jgi:hypothetical protein